MTVLMSDVSSWQDSNATNRKIDFLKMKSKGVEAVFIRYSAGGRSDEDHIDYWKGSGDQGMLRSPYHFLTWDVSPVAQADYFIKLIGDHPCEIKPALDFEWWSTTPPNVISILDAFMNRFVSVTGIKPIIYTAPGFWYSYGSTNAKWAGYDLWVAHWNVAKPVVPLPWKTWKFWQYTVAKGKGPEYGCESADIDLDYFNGTLEELKVYAGVATPPLTDAEKLAKLWSAHPELH